MEYQESAPPPVLVPILEAQRRLGGVSRATVLRLVEDKKLRSVLIRGRRMIGTKSIDDLTTGESKAEGNG